MQRVIGRTSRVRFDARNPFPRLVFNALEDVAPRGISRSCGVRNSQLSESNYSAFNLTYLWFHAFG